MYEVGGVLSPYANYLENSDTVVRIKDEASQSGKRKSQFIAIDFIDVMKR